MQVVTFSTGRLGYNVTDFITGERRLYLEEQVMHLRDRSDDGGKIGRSVLSRSAKAVSGVEGANSLASTLLRSGSHPSGFLSAPGAISKDTANRLKETWNSFSGNSAGRVAIAGDGLKFESLSITPEAAELLESRRFGVQEIARLFLVPPIFAGDYSSSTFTNAETMVRLFGSFCLGQWATKLQQEFSLSVLSREYEMVIDLSAFLRGDDKTRWETWNIAKSQNILTVDEIRANEGYGPMPKANIPAT